MTHDYKHEVRDYNDGQIHGWNGGACPVHPKTVVRFWTWGDVAVHCSIEEGVCCCGDNMENHTNPMDCGHTPLDHGTYIAIQLAEKTRATLAEIKGESHE